MIRVLALAILFAAFAWSCAYPHDRARPELNAWFDHLSSGKGPCCSYADGISVDDPDWESVNGHYRVRIANTAKAGDPFEWVEVPDEAVITEPNRAGRTMVWPVYGTVITIRCFIVGSMT